MNQLGLRCWTALFSIAILISGCGGGGSTSVGAASTVTLAPTTLSLDFGQVTSLTPTIKDANGTQILTITPTFQSSNTALVTVSNSGLVCAGTWDSLTTPVVCAPATTAGTANVTATASGITSAATVVSVHPRITSLTISAATAVCVSDTMTAQLSVTAHDAAGNPVPTVGTPTWASNNANVVTIDANGLATAKQPGSTSVFATVGSVTSLPTTFITCPPKSISLATSVAATPTSLALTPGATGQLTATAIDILGNPMPDLTGATALTTSSSQPAVASVTATGLVTAVAAGNTGVVAICAPPGCNPSGGAIYSNLVTVNVSGTSATTVYVTGVHATSIVPIDTTTNTAGTAIAIPTVNSVQPVINSFVFSQSGARAFIGTDQGLFGLDATATTTTLAAPLNVAGTVLAVSPNAAKVIVAQATQVLVVDTAASTAETLAISSATAAKFLPDSTKAFIVAGSTLYVYPPAVPLTSKTLAAPATDVTFLSQGSAAYFAGGSAAGINVRSTCDANSLTDVTVPAVPSLIASSFDSASVFAVDTTSIDDVAVTTSTAPCPSAVPAPTTPPPPLVSNSLKPRVAFGGTFTPNQLILLGDTSHVYVTNSGSSLLQYDTVAGTASQIALLGVGATSTTTGGATLDSLNVYIGVLGTNDVQRINVASGLDVQQIPVSLGTGATPDFVVVRPK